MQKRYSFKVPEEHEPRLDRSHDQEENGRGFEVMMIGRNGKSQKLTNLAE